MLHTRSTHANEGADDVFAYDNELAHVIPGQINEGSDVHSAFSSQVNTLPILLNFILRYVFSPK